jgi:hypothetical protein
MTKVNLSKVRAAVVAALNEKVTVGDARVIMERGEGGRVTGSRHEIMVMSGKLTIATTSTARSCSLWLRSWRRRA